MKQTICLQCGRVFFGIISFLAHTCQVEADLSQQRDAFNRALQDWALVKYGPHASEGAEAEIAELERMYQL